MLKSFRCFRKGHLFVDSRSEAGVQVCVRCRHRQPFEGLQSLGPRETREPDYHQAS